jgi:hypothetical protein
VSARRAVVLTLTLALAACADIPTGGGAGDFDAAWQRWQRSRPADYRYDVQVLCFCTEERTRTVTAVVAGGAPAALFYADSGNAADTVLFADVRTMDRLFTTLRAALDRHPYRFDAMYEAGLGYPLAVSIDADAQIVDEEIAYRVTNFGRLR